MPSYQRIEDLTPLNISSKGIARRPVPGGSLPPKDVKSATTEEQVYYSVDFLGPPTRRTVAIPPILIESIQVAGRIKGCTFSLILFFVTPLTFVLAFALHSSLGKRHKSAASEEKVYYSVDFCGPPTRRTVTIPPILIESIKVAGRIKGCTFSLMLLVATPSPLPLQLLYTTVKESDTSQ
jgi:hypothetical protein